MQRWISTWWSCGAGRSGSRPRGKGCPRRATVVVGIVKALLELALYGAALGEDLLGVEVPLPPGVARP
eukprot:1545103-Pyramimonas_sp.AAC.1